MAIIKECLFIATGNGHLDPLHYPVDIIQVSALGCIDIDIHSLGFDFRKKLNRLLQTDNEQPSLEHQDQNTQGKAY